MQIKYYETAWRDISNSPGWFGKLCLLALVNFIPIFGQIVTFGYFYGWAREIAWGVHAPMPAKIFCNDDGKFWKRGWFILVLVFAFALIPCIVMGIGSAMSGAGYYGVAAGAKGAAGAALGSVGSLLYFVGLLGAIFMCLLAWIGSMRVAIYDRLSAGFQFGKIWKMFRRDTGGIARIFGMYILVGLIVGLIVSVIVTILLVIVMVVGVAGAMGAGFTPESVQHMTDAQAMRFLIRFMASAGVVGFICMFAALFVCLLASMYLCALVYRAVGYWTMQFDVPHWRGQDDPLPFEMMGGM